MIMLKRKVTGGNKGHTTQNGGQNKNQLLTGVLTAAMEPNSQSGEVISEVGGHPKKTFKKKTQNAPNLLDVLCDRLEDASITAWRRVRTPPQVHPSIPAHTLLHIPPSLPPTPPPPLPSHRRYGSVRSKWLGVSAVESDLNTGLGTDKQTQQKRGA